MVELVAWLWLCRYFKFTEDVQGVVGEGSLVVIGGQEPR